MAEKPGLEQELALWQAGYRRIAGLDEAGRGAWAGPVVAAAVVLPSDAAVIQRLTGVADSKQLTALQRERLFDLLSVQAASIGVGVVEASRIDAIGIAPATRQAMTEALAQLEPPADFLLIDYVRLAHLPTSQRSLVRGDSFVLSIAAASIIAKVTRDRLMVDLAKRFPTYGFERHKGYGTLQHQAALAQHGPCPIHRRSFQPVRGQQMALPSALQAAEHPLEDLS